MPMGVYWPQHSTDRLVMATNITLGSWTNFILEAYGKWRKNTHQDVPIYILSTYIGLHSVSMTPIGIDETTQPFQCDQNIQLQNVVFTTFDTS
jgi:hypothetical protein